MMTGPTGETHAEWDGMLLAPLWASKTVHKAGIRQPRPHHWRWSGLHRSAMQAAEIASPEVVERRVLRLVNPDATSDADESTVGTIVAAIQTLLPGESARPHRHSMHALRFVLEGEGVETIVDGHPIPMNSRDMLLTPGWCWHGHRHSGERPMIWLDVLDAPLHALLGTVEFEPGPPNQYPDCLPADAFAAPNVVPLGVKTGVPYSPIFIYPYQAITRAVAAAPVGPDRARSVRYVNPVNGGAVLPTLECRMVELMPSQQTRAVRTNASTVVLVVDGEGESWIGDQHYSWSKFDIFTCPQNSWASHKSDGRARIFTISDRESLRRLDLLRDELQ